MLIRKLTLVNFGTYAGINEIDLISTPDRPVVLIGGSNGAGKTTLLESILLCLHGRRALRGPTSNRDYQASIQTRFHSPAEGSWQPSESAVKLEFEIAEGGEEHCFEVTRRWRRSRSGTIREALYLKRDGEAIDDLPESAWQDFLDGLVPPGVAGLFFFDGERIQALANDESGVRLREAVRRLLGLDLIEQLRLDLARYLSANPSEDLPAVERASVERMQEAQAAREKIESLRAERESLFARRELLAAEAARVRDVFARRGGSLAVDRQRLVDKHGKAREAAVAAEARVRELSAGLLPFAICASIAEQVRARITAEAAAEEAAVVDQRLKAAAPALREKLTTSDGEDVVTTLERLLGTGMTSAGKRVHDLTPTERAVLDDQLRRLREEVPRAARGLAKDLRKAEETRTRTKELLETAPEESDVADLIVELQTRERELAALEHEIEGLDSSLQRALYDFKVAERERKRAADTVRDFGSAASRVSQAVRVSAVLTEFEERSQHEKLGVVELEAARYFNRLSRKGSLLSRVQIDPETFKVDLRRWDDADLPRERLSAGEKQLLAISLLWALAKVSGRPLPVVIDTPLGRLDRHHRDRLLTDYFPSVSHQVIVLSTDTEVDAAAAAGLEPVTSHTYELVHDLDKCRTSVRQGYFPIEAEAVDAR